MKKNVFKSLLLLAAILCAGSLHAQTVLQNVYAHKHSRSTARGRPSSTPSTRLLRLPPEGKPHRLLPEPHAPPQARPGGDDFVPAEQLYVPGDWNTQRPELFLYEGSIWYKKNFNYQR